MNNQTSAVDNSTHSVQAVEMFRAEKVGKMVIEIGSDLARWKQVKEQRIELENQVDKKKIARQIESG